MPIKAVGRDASSLLMEKALSNKSKANKLEQASVPLADAATKQLDAKEMAEVAKVVKTKATPPTNPGALPSGKLDVKA